MSLQDPSLPFEPPAEGSALLVRGGPMTGKYALALRTLATGDRAILLSTGAQAAHVFEDFAAYGDPERLAVVDGATRPQGGTADHEAHEDRVRYVSSPENLTALGVKFTDLAESFATEGERTVVGLHSLSELLVYWDTQRVYQFLRVLVGQSREFGWPVVAVLDDVAADDQAVHALLEPFDRVVDTREGDEGPEFRLRGGDDPDPTWTAF